MEEAMKTFLLKEATRLREEADFHTIVANTYLDERDQCIANRKDWKAANKASVVHEKLAIKFRNRAARTRKLIAEQGDI